MVDNTRPFQQGGAPTEEQLAAFGKLAQMMKGARSEPEYVPIMKSLEAIHVNYKIIDVMLGDIPTECLVVPLQDLMYREWTHMSGGQPITPQREGTNES
jgi:hypothetical protein